MVYGMRLLTRRFRRCIKQPNIQRLFRRSSNYFNEESAPLLTNMVSEKVHISQQVLVSQSNLSQARRSTQYLAALIATIGGFIAGTSLAWTSPVTSEAIQLAYGISVSDDSIAWIGSFMALGAMVGSIITAVLVDRIGRKNVILTMIVPCVIGWAIIAFSTSVMMFCGGRFLTGISAGCFCVVVPLYTSEIAEKDIRGTLGTYFQLQMTFGILAVYVLGSFLTAFWLTVFCGIVPFFFAAFMLLLPETPYFHMMKRNLPQAQNSLAWFRGQWYDSKVELDVIQKSLDDDAADKTPLLRAFGTTAAKRGLVIGLGVMFLQQFSGCNAVIFYTKTIFTAAGATIDPNTSTIIVGVAQCISTYVATLVVDRLGRKILLLVSIMVMALSTFTLGLYFYLKLSVKADVSSIGWLPLLSMSSFIVIFSLGFGPIPWMLMAEIFPSKIKGAACSLAALVNWQCVFLVTKLFPVLVNSLGIGPTFWCFTVCSTFGTAFVLFLVPETKGKTLLEVQEMLAGHPAPRSIDYAAGSAPFEGPKVRI